MIWLPWLPFWAVIVASNSWAGASEVGVILGTNIFSQENGVLKGGHHRFPGGILTFSIPFLVAVFREQCNFLVVF